MDLNEEKQLKGLIAYLGKYYNAVNVAPPHYIDVHGSRLPIWQMWLQGRDQAPPLVKKCLESVKKYSDGRVVNLITQANVGNFVELPGFIYDKCNNGSITRTHFSDIIRLCLLEEHGGTWIDATVLLTDKIPACVGSEHFFAFRAMTDNIYSAHTLFSTWFIHAKPNHALIRNLKTAMFRYWERERELMNYFLMHFLAFGMILASPTLTKIWLECSQMSNEPPNMLGKHLHHRFDQKVFDLIRKATPIHKLTYKYGEVVPESFLAHLLLD